MLMTSSAEAAMCDLAAALNPAAHGQAGWTCSGGSPILAVCSWGSVTCSGGSITSIYLQSVGLTGTFPTSIGALLTLQQLEACCNNIGGTIPSTIGLLSSLTYLSIGSNNLVGSIPSTIGYMSALTIIYLDTNHLTGTVPSTFGYLTNLRYLHLSSNTGINSLTGSLPTALCLVGLTHLGIFSTYLTCYPSCLYSVSSLTAGTVRVCDQSTNRIDTCL